MHIRNSNMPNSNETQPDPKHISVDVCAIVSTVECFHFDIVRLHVMIRMFIKQKVVCRHASNRIRPARKSMRNPFIEHTFASSFFSFVLHKTQTYTNTQADPNACRVVRYVRISHCCRMRGRGSCAPTSCPGNILMVVCAMSCVSGAVVDGVVDAIVDNVSGAFTFA